jgi:hypothetical protein
MAEEKVETTESTESFGDTWARGMEFLDGALGEEAKEKEEPKKEASAPETEDCPECPGGKKEKPPVDERKPIKTIKVQGKDVHLYTEQEIDEYLSKGIDYTKKTQTLAEEKRGLMTREEQLQEQFRTLQEKVEKLSTYQKPERDADAPPEKTRTIFEEFEIDEDYAEPWQKKMLTHIQSLRNMNDEMASRSDKMSRALEMMLMEKSVNVIEGAIQKAREEFPVRQILDEGGEDITKKQFITLLAQKANEQMGKPQPRSMPELAREAVKEIHDFQRLASGQAVNQVVDMIPKDDAVNVDDFKTKYPKAYNAIKDNAVADYLARRDELPPTLNKTGADVSTAKIKSDREEKGYESIGEGFDRGFEDPDLLRTVAEMSRSQG